MNLDEAGSQSSILNNDDQPWFREKVLWAQDVFYRSQNMTQSYDIIGDMHGYADKLVALLEKMGYEQLGLWGERTPVKKGASLSSIKA